MSTPFHAVIRPPFVEFPKVHRLSREMIVTEKIDGTNGSIFIDPEGVVIAGSRTRWITPEQDHYGFARWVREHEDELRALGPGTHFGEWWGAGIQRRYGLTEKRFSLFNVSRWTSELNLTRVESSVPVEAPVSTVCLEAPVCHVVPILVRGVFDTLEIDSVLYSLRLEGSHAAPGFMQPEGVVVFHVASGMLFKKTLDKNDGHKGQVAA